MDNATAQKYIRTILSEVRLPDGRAAVDKFTDLRQVDAKIREAKNIFRALPHLPPTFVAEMDADQDFTQQSRRVRLESLSHYCDSALRFLNTGGFTATTKQIYPIPDISKLTSVMPNLEGAIKRRWEESQKCQHSGFYLASVILMGSVLEGLLLARAQQSSSVAYAATKSPKEKSGKSVAIQHWSLNQLIDVAVEVGWLKSDRGKFGHALRESRNVVHPWVEVSTHANFDEATCNTSWEVLKASVNDLVSSCP